MTDPARKRTLKWRDGHDRTPLDAKSETELVAVMRKRSHYANVADDAGYMQAVARRFRELDGVTVRSDSPANFIEDLVAVGHIEAVWVDETGGETRITPDGYRLARLRASGIPVLDAEDMDTGTHGGAA